MLSVEFKGKQYSLSLENILKFEEIYQAITTAKAKKKERIKNIACLILKDRTLVQEMLTLSDEAIERLSKETNGINYSKEGLLKTRFIPFKKEN
jgi:hypothetical protein